MKPFSSRSVVSDEGPCEIRDVFELPSQGLDTLVASAADLPRGSIVRLGDMFSRPHAKLSSPGGLFGPRFAT